MHVPALAHTESAGGTHTPPLSSPSVTSPRLASPRLSLAESPSCPVADARRGMGDSPASARPLEIRNSDGVEFCRIRERKGQIRNRRPVVARCAFDEGIRIHRARAFAHRLLDRSRARDIEASAPRNGRPRWDARLEERSRSISSGFAKRLLFGLSSDSFPKIPISSEESAAGNKSSIGTNDIKRECRLLDQRSFVSRWFPLR